MDSKKYYDIAYLFNQTQESIHKLISESGLNKLIENHTEGFLMQALRNSVEVIQMNPSEKTVDVQLQSVLSILQTVELRQDLEIIILRFFMGLLTLRNLRATEAFNHVVLRLNARGYNPIPLTSVNWTKGIIRIREVDSKGNPVNALNEILSPNTRQKVSYAWNGQTEDLRTLHSELIARGMISEQTSFKQVQNAFTSQSITLDPKIRWINTLSLLAFFLDQLHENRLIDYTYTIWSQMCDIFEKKNGDPINDSGQYHNRNMGKTKIRNADQIEAILAKFSS